MKITIDTEKKTIELLESISFLDLQIFMSSSFDNPEDWTIKVVDWSEWKEVNKPANPFNSNNFLPKPFQPMIHTDPYNPLKIMYTTGTPLIGPGGIDPLTVTY